MDNEELIGDFIGRFPRNATVVLKELGLALFLFVQVGLDTGKSFVEFLDFQAIYYAFSAILFPLFPWLDVSCSGTIL